MADDPTSANLPVPQPGRMAGARPHLEVRAGPEKGRSFRVAPGVTVVGRDPTCDVVLTEEAISRQHCRIERSGDQWILRNLSSNGTRIKRKEVEEHVLSNGNEIRIGSKTRLIFVVEEVTRETEGQAQFRPRTGVAAAEPEDVEVEPETEEAEQPPSLFQRRKALFIGLAVYLMVMVVGGLVAALYLKGCGGRGMQGDTGIPRLSLDERIIQAGGFTPLAIDRTSTAGIWCIDARGEQVLVPHEDLRTGKARRVPGIRQAINVEYLTREEHERRVRAGEASESYPYVLRNPRSRMLADQFKRQAIEAYLVCNMPGNESRLFMAVRGFQQALAHYAMRFLPDPAEDKMRQDATKKLIDKVYDLYTQAILLESAGDYRRAAGTYEKVLAYVPEPENLISRNVSAHFSALRERVREEGRRNR
ncbi:MAG: FHA domain-containing protein [Planctomycetes bacterium]|nr:FHA domain-containing protein [Planctomycetota bacterium]